MWKHEDPEKDSRWMNAMFALLGSLFVLTILMNFLSALSALLG